MRQAAAAGRAEGGFVRFGVASARRASDTDGWFGVGQRSTGGGYGDATPSPGATSDDPTVRAVAGELNALMAERVKRLDCPSDAPAADSTCSQHGPALPLDCAASPDPTGGEP